MVGMEWEPWYTPANNEWALMEAVPILGLYDSFNYLVVKQHAIWMVEAGIDFVIVDWTNNIWGDNTWSERGVYAQVVLCCVMLFPVAFDSIAYSEIAIFLSLYSSAIIFSIIPIRFSLYTATDQRDYVPA